MPSKGNGILYIVATPIGNLKDISERARDCLASVQGVLCEDTRRAAQLLRALGVELRPTHRLDAHASEATLSGWVDQLVAGAELALISDAGTPGVSDPGGRLVSLARSAGVAVVAVPGASAVAALVSLLGAASASEEQSPGFEFVGFLPRKGMAKRWLEWIGRVGDRDVLRIVAFESPHRIVGTLKEIAETQIPEGHGGVLIRCVVAKELTKLHERVWEGGVEQVYRDVQAEVLREGALGEWCVAWVFHTMERDPSQGLVISEEDQTIALPWSRWLEILLDLEVPVSRAVSAICQEFGAPKNAVYARAVAFAHSAQKKKLPGG